MIKVPFTAYARIVPDREYNKRRTYTKALEKIAAYVATDIQTYIDANPDTIWINENAKVLSTVQFAQFPSRLTVVGWHIRSSVVNFQPASKITVDAPYTTAGDDNYSGIPGKTVSGYAATQYLHPQGQTLDASTVTGMKALKSALEAASPYLDEIYRIDYQGITFGKGGFSF